MLDFAIKLIYIVINKATFFENMKLDRNGTPNEPRALATKAGPARDKRLRTG
jgi:hypothetical protein